MDPELRDRLKSIVEGVDSLVPEDGPRPGPQLRGLDDDALKALIADSAAGPLERVAALERLAGRLCREKSLTDLLLPLLEDPADALAAAALRSLPPFDARAVEALRTRLDDVRLGDLALETLARRRDPVAAARIASALGAGGLPEFRRALGLLAFVVPRPDLLEALDRHAERAEALDALDAWEAAYLAAVRLVGPPPEAP